ncbi:anhydro-N-acetylmuramic acid kinase [Noviherbaspirillum pedocola]|uniref:Anhydro-N-acetylmuramic acid kinase n=1 Tax=Noviherbaspirillum pedocola TaxID=2801341 RepID=A0A934W117_9BURK|nr:anhydro-N-acetylmuramic acid kinase [Noviherbaspirillum pedocola]MBK4734711.1 anhydro-N-acetylmuramic acid kinase [Noviherbaspirillum pedocola]
MSASPSLLYIGLMSGTSLDGVDGVLARFDQTDSSAGIATLAAAHLPFDDALKAELMALQSSGADEIHREALAANALAERYAACVAQVLAAAGVPANAVHAVGVHGQTIRHQPARGYTRQTNNPALLAELSSIDVIADFRSRDIAAGGQGAPLVPAFHHAVFAAPDRTRVVANIGGIANISILDPARNGDVIGFDTGPGNVLMDGWMLRHQGQPYDRDGAWAAGGRIVPELLEELGREAYLSLPPPKSTGRDLFHLEWLDERLAKFDALIPRDVQATLTEFTALTLADAIVRHAAQASEVFVCGGGARNSHLMVRLREALGRGNRMPRVEATDALGIDSQHVEALAFAWLARQFDMRLAGNLPTATGARGSRILGALYPA